MVHMCTQLRGIGEGNIEQLRSEWSATATETEEKKENNIRKTGFTWNKGRTHTVKDEQK